MNAGMNADWLRGMPHAKAFSEAEPVLEQPNLVRVQATQQGGVEVFDGTHCVLERKDRATGDHIDLRDLLAVAKPLAKQGSAK